MKKILAMALAVVMMMAMSIPAFAETTLTGQMGYECVITDEGHTCTFDETGKMTCEGAIETGLTHSVIDSSSTLKTDTDYTIDVVGKLDANNNGIPDEDETDPTPIPETPTIAVDIYWTDMVFNYQQSWDDVNLTYIWNWQNGEDYIQVDNRSSVGIDASVTFTGDTTNGFADTAVEFAFDSDNAVAATWADNTLTLGYGNQATAEQLEADSTTVVTPSGTLNVNVADTTTMTTGEGAAESVTLGQITIRITQAAAEEDAAVPTSYTLTEEDYNTYTSADNRLVLDMVPGEWFTITWTPVGNEVFTDNIAVQSITYGYNGESVDYGYQQLEKTTDTWTFMMAAGAANGMTLNAHANAVTADGAVHTVYFTFRAVVE